MSYTRFVWFMYMLSLFGCLIAMCFLFVHSFYSYTLYYWWLSHVWILFIECIETIRVSLSPHPLLCGYVALSTLNVHVHVALDNLLSCHILCILFFFRRIFWCWIYMYVTTPPITHTLCLFMRLLLPVLSFLSLFILWLKFIYFPVWFILSCLWMDAVHKHKHPQ